MTDQLDKTAVEAFMLCPWCGAKNDRASIAKGDEPVQPASGDAMLCFQCGEFAIYEPQLPGMSRRPDRKEARELRQDSHSSNVRRAWKQWKAAQPLH